jgi:6-phosphogluconolactonase
VVETSLVILADGASLAAEAARRLVDALAGAVARRGEAHLALTGGSAALLLYPELVRPRWQAAVDWSRVHLWWGDERCVPVDHPDSNTGLAYELLLALTERSGESGSGASGADVTAGAIAALPVRADHVHPIDVGAALRGDEGLAAVAQEYGRQLERHLPSVAGVPAFDAILLGVGPDGHILSLFPHSPALESSELVVAVPAPDHVEPRLERLTLTARLLTPARCILVLATGGAKARIMASVLGNQLDSARWPAQLARRPQAAWLLDAAAAAELADRQGSLSSAG